MRDMLRYFGCSAHGASRVFCGSKEVVLASYDVIRLTKKGNFDVSCAIEL